MASSNEVNRMRAIYYPIWKSIFAVFAACLLLQTCCAPELLADPPLKANKRIKVDSHIWSIAAFPSKEQFAFSDDNGIVWLLDAQMGQVKQFTRAADGTVPLVRITADGKELITSDYKGTITFWNIETKQTSRILIPPEQPAGLERFRLFALSRNGKVLLSSGSKEGELHVWSIAEKSYLEKQIKPKEPRGTANFQATCIAFSDSGRLVATGHHDQRIRVWEVATGMQLYTLSSARFQFEPQFAITPDGWSLVWFESDKLAPCFFELATGRQHRQLKGISSVWSIQTSPDGGRLFIAGVGFWDLTNEKMHPVEQIKIKLPATPPHLHGAISYSGRYSVVGTSDKEIYIWRLEPSRPAMPHLPKRQAKNIDQALLDLASQDPGIAYKAIWAIAGDARTIPKIQLVLTSLQDRVAAQKKRFELAVAGLNSSSFRQREKSVLDLRSMGPDAEPFLRHYRKKELSRELRLRVDEAFQHIKGTSHEYMVWERSLEVLELIGTADAAKAISTLSITFPREYSSSAIDSLNRLKKKLANS
jgi:hypothetical protein